MRPTCRPPRPHLSRLLIAAAAAVVCVVAGRVATASAGDPATTADAPPPVPVAAVRAAAQPRLPADVARLFRFHAAAEANALRDAADRATFDETRRGELKLLVREHLRRVEEEVVGVAAATPLDDVLARATDLARDFNDREIAAWLDEHPAVYQPVQEQIALAEAYERSVAEEPEAVLRTAKAAGLPPEREASMRRLVTDAHERLRAADEADGRRLSEAEAKASASSSVPSARRAGPPATPVSRDLPPQTERPGHAAPTDAPRAEGGPRADAPQAQPPPAAAARPATPEEEKLRLLDALTFVDAQARVAAAGREVRAEVEKLLPHPLQRKALADEMLRWYQAYAPAPDASDEPTAPGGSTPRRPDAGGPPPLKSDPRPRPDTRRAPTKFDPGF